MELAGTNHQCRKHLTIAEVNAEYGGSIAFWRKAIFEKRIPYVKFGRSVRISRNDLEGWLAARRVEGGARNV